MDTSASNARTSLVRLRSFVRNPNFVLIVAGLVGSLAFLMLVCFVALTWFGRDTNTISGAKILLGGNEIFPTLGLVQIRDVDLGIEYVTFSREGGLLNLRFIDWMLVIVPLGVVGLLVLVGMVIVEKLPVEQGLGGMTAIAALLFVFPFVWQGLSSSHWQDFLEDKKVAEVDKTLDAMKEGYSTGEQKLFGLLLLLVSGAGYGLYVAEKQGLLGVGELPMLMNDEAESDYAAETHEDYFSHDN